MSHGLDFNARFTEGEGTPLVFIHGWLDTMEGWETVAAALDMPNPFLFYDQRCHGDSACEPFAMGDLADDLHALLERHGITEPVLVGHSMGGMVALTYTVRYDTPMGLFLLGTCASTPEPAVHSPRWFLDRFDEMPRRAWAELIAENYLGETGGAAWKETVEALVAAEDAPVVHGLEAMVDYDVREPLQDVDVAARVVAGSDDNAITGEKTAELARLLGCEREVLDASHRLLQEAPREVADSLSDFVQRLS